MYLIWGRRIFGDDDLASSEQPCICRESARAQASQGHCGHNSKSGRRTALKNADARTWKPRQHAGQAEQRRDKRYESGQTANQRRERRQ